MQAIAGVLPNRTLGFMNEKQLAECIDEELAKSRAIVVKNGMVTLDPEYMKLGKFYFVELTGEPYIYRKVSETEIEIYGLAEKI